MRLDGSGRLTVRNRRFVKRIVSPRDLPIHEETNDSLSGDTVGQVGGPVYGGDVRQQIEGSRAVEQPVDSPHEDVQHPQVEDDRRGGVVGGGC